MKFTLSRTVIAVAAIALFASASFVKGQSFTSGSLNLDGSNILDVGSVVYAYNLDDDNGGTGSGADTTLNGVNFIGIDPYNVSSSNFTLTSPNEGFDTTNNKDGSGTGLAPGDPLYTLQDRGAYYQVTLTLENLVPSQEYVVQLEIGEQPGDNRYQSYTDGSATSATVYAHDGPMYIDDTFTAGSGGTETLQANVGGGQGAQLTGFVLEEAPEPSTWAMMGLGLAGLAFLGFSRRVRFNS